MFLLIDRPADCLAENKIIERDDEDDEEDLDDNEDDTEGATGSTEYMCLDDNGANITNNVDNANMTNKNVNGRTLNDTPSDMLGQGEEYLDKKLVAACRSRSSIFFDDPIAFCLSLANQRMPVQDQRNRYPVHKSVSTKRLDTLNHGQIIHLIQMMYTTADWTRWQSECQRDNKAKLERAVAEAGKFKSAQWDMQRRVKALETETADLRSVAKEREAAFAELMDQTKHGCERLDRLNKQLREAREEAFFCAPLSHLPYRETAGGSLLRPRILRRMFRFLERWKLVVHVRIAGNSNSGHVRLF